MANAMILLCEIGHSFARSLKVFASMGFMTRMWCPLRARAESSEGFIAIR